MSLTIGSLFSGIGGLELGLEWAGLGPVVWQVEKDPKCRAVLATHWPEVERHEDVCTVGSATLARVDIICGGFPCQDISSAGRRAGLAGARSGLWHEFARVVEECRPRWVVVENVRSGARKYVDAVRGALGRLGYASLPLPLGAGDCGAPHERARVFIVACAASDAVRERRYSGLRGVPFRASSEVAEAVCARRTSANADRQELRHSDAPRPSIPQPVNHVGWSVEPRVARVVHGLPGRVDRERMLGNAVVPQCAEVVGHVIRNLMEVQT